MPHPEIVQLPPFLDAGFWDMFRQKTGISDELFTDVFRLLAEALNGYHCYIEATRFGIDRQNRSVRFYPKRGTESYVSTRYVPPVESARPVVCITVGTQGPELDKIISRLSSHFAGKADFSFRQGNGSLRVYRPNNLTDSSEYFTDPGIEDINWLTQPPDDVEIDEDDLGLEKEL